MDDTLDPFAGEGNAEEKVDQMGGEFYFNGKDHVVSLAVGHGMIVCHGQTRNLAAEAVLQAVTRADKQDLF